MAEAPDEKECTVCTNYFTTPKILPCGHLLCRACLISWMDSSPDPGCPLCRCPIVEPGHHAHRKAANVADALPTDLVMETLVKSARVLAQDPSCHACEEGKADFICLQCLDMMCVSCAKIHKRMSMTRGHDVESLSTVTAERLAARGPAMCADHGEKHSFFCHDHGLALCASCKDVQHKTCRTVNRLDEEMTSAKKSLEDLMVQIKKEEQTLEQALAHLESRLVDVVINEQDDMVQIDKACDHLHLLVEDFRMNVKAMSRASHSQFIKSLNEVKSARSQQLANVTSHKNIVLRARAVAPTPALIPAVETLKNRVNSFNLRYYFIALPSKTSKRCEDKLRQIEKILRIQSHV